MIARVFPENMDYLTRDIAIFTHLGLAMTTLISSPRRLKTGIQYLPVDSIQAS